MSDGLFHDDDIIRRVTQEGLLIAAGGVASLLQTSHPKVAQGVHDHSYTFDDPMARLRNTMGWVYTVVFGSREEAEQISAIVTRMHDKVVGPDYEANDPELQVWVAATLFAVAAQAYQMLFRRRFTEAELEEYYQQSKIYATILGCPEERMPATYRDFREYYAHMVGTLRINDASRYIADGVLHPTNLPLVMRPGLVPIRLITYGLMPPAIREQYGWRYGRLREIQFHLLMMVLSLVYPRLPERIRTLPRAIYLYQIRKMLSRRAGGGPRLKVRSTAA
ncbi:oxygenase MpaB family protein [Thermomonospora amylolytica]|uniref:oxygenase MpaB family protein n=1 Tax=Thermomonospora amylolytica TaxID=1411117 RepID=UPI000E6C9BBD|nr:oxygenase MpaB family protein [Thermomonospora amylolytica]